MDDLFSIHPGIPHPGNVAKGTISQLPAGGLNNDATGASSSTVSDFLEFFRAQISGHPGFPALLSAYIDCRKVNSISSWLVGIRLRRYSSVHPVTWKQVGAPPDVTSLLEGIRQKSNTMIAPAPNEVGSDPELDNFMVTTVH